MPALGMEFYFCFDTKEQIPDLGMNIMKSLTGTCVALPIASALDVLIRTRILVGNIRKELFTWCMTVVITGMVNRISAAACGLHRVTSAVRSDCGHKPGLARTCRNTMILISLLKSNVPYSAH